MPLFITGHRAGDGQSCNAGIFGCGCEAGRLCAETAGGG